MRILTLGSLFLLTSPVLGAPQHVPQTWGQVQIADSNAIEWPAGIGGAGPFERVVVGRITAHDEISAVVLKGGIATLVYRPTHFNALAELSSTVFTDITVLADPDLADQDGVVGAGPSGLVRIEYDPVTLTFDETPLGGPQWASASRLVGIDLDQVGSQDLLGLDADGDTALLLYWEETTGNLSETQIPLGANCYSITALDWDDDNANEILVYHGDDVDVYELSGGPPIDSVRIFNPGGAFAPLPNPGGPDHLTLAMRNPADNKDLFFTYNSSGYEMPFALKYSPPGGGTAAPIDVVETVSGDWDGDGDLDVLLAHEQFHQAILMDNAGTASSPVFDTTPANTIRLGLGPIVGLPATGNRAVPAFADLDRDPFTTADMVFALDSTGEVVVKVSAPELVYNGNPSNPPVWEFFAGESTYAQFSDHGLLHLHLQGIPTSLTTNYGYIQVGIWSQADPVTPNEPPATDSVGVYNQIHRIAEDPTLPGNLILPIEIPRGGDEDDNPFWDEREHLYLLLRFVDVVPWQTGYRVTEGSYPLALGMTMPFDENEADEYEQDPLASPAYSYLVEIGIPSGSITLTLSSGYINSYVGAIIPQNAIPPFPEPSTPHLPLLEEGDPTFPWDPDA